jgi:hypothetical protein
LIGSTLTAVGGSASPTSLLTNAGPDSSDPVTVAFEQPSPPTLPCGQGRSARR